MVSNPSSEQNITKYLLSLAAIVRNQESVPIGNLEPQFDLNAAYLKLEREPIDPDDSDGHRRIIDLGWQALEESGFEEVQEKDFWRDLVIEPLSNHSKELARFLNFYISHNFDQLVQGLHENWGVRGVEDNWRFYDLMCNYKY